MAEPITERDHEQVRRLHAEGKSPIAIARAIGRSAARPSRCPTSNCTRSMSRSTPGFPAGTAACSRERPSPRCSRS